MSPFLWLGLAVMVSGTSAEPVSTGARVVVYGSTPGGISAAVAAARNNVSVTLLSESVHIGGMR
jgi:NADPH-dependent 2,4-dienoyl-CoA reductase/sulfur reductase-like enzyme